MKTLFLVIATIAAATMIATARAESASGCTLAKVDEWPLRQSRLQLVVDGEINGKKVAIMLATGLSRSLIMDRAAARLGLARDNPTGPNMNFSTGRLSTDPVVVDELRIGKISGKGIKLLKLERDSRREGVDIMLGMDILGRFETEFDVPGRKVRIFAAKGCAESSLAYWSPRTATVVPLEQAGRAKFTVQLNGRSAQAGLSTGTVFSLVDRSVANSLGFRPGGPGIAAADCPAGPENDDAGMWVAPFERLVIGDELIRNLRLRVADTWKHEMIPRTGSRLATRPSNLPDLLLGADFLNTHRVLLSPGQRKLYFTYAGGLVFPSLPGQECAGLPQDGGARSSIADLDAAVARDGQDARALLSRGIAMALANDHDRALADFDAALRIAPRNAFILAWRAHEQLQKQEYDRAIADYDAALLIGAQDASIHINRGKAWRAKGDVDKALADYATAVQYDPRDPRALTGRAATWLAKQEPDKARADYDAALALDPGNAAAIRGRGLVEFSLGRFEQAELAFAERMRVAPSAQIAVWLHVVRARGGKDGRAELDRFAQSNQARGWPEPIIRFHLGRLDRDGLLAAAANADPRVQREQECEANFQLGQHGLIAGDPRAAEPFLAKAAAQCPADFVEMQAAKAELKRLP